MKEPTSHPMWRLRGQPLRAAVFVLLLALWALASCSRDGETPVGAGLIDDLLGSVPGSTFVDTLAVFDDTSVPIFNVALDQDPELELGIESEYERAMILRPDFGSLEGDTVALDSAYVRIRMSGGDINIRGRIMYLGTRYTEGDTIGTLDTLWAIPDPVTGSVIRTFELAETEYYIPADTVEAWLMGDRNNGIAIIYDGTPDELSRFYSSEGESPPRFNLVSAGGSLPGTEYPVNDDVTYIRPTTTTGNLVVSDEFIRRIHWRTDLQALGDSNAVNNAVVRFYVDVPETLGTPQNLTMYVPDSPWPTSAGFLTGTNVSGATVTVDSLSAYVEFPMTLTVLGILTGSIADNGFVIRYTTENLSLRQAEFFASIASVDSLRPRVVFTLSSPAEFDR